MGDERMDGCTSRQVDAQMGYWLQRLIGGQSYRMQLNWERKESGQGRTTDEWAVWSKQTGVNTYNEKCLA